MQVDGVDQLWDRTGYETLISTSTGDNYLHAPGMGVLRDDTDWLLRDAVGSVRHVTDTTGAVTASAAFTAFGEPRAIGTSVFGFAGEQTDPNTLVHLRARAYNPALGTFTAYDPVQPGGPSTAGWNHYTYSANNPTTWTDPTGETTFAERVLLTIVAAAVVVTGVAIVLIYLQRAALNPAGTPGAPGFDFPGLSPDIFTGPVGDLAIAGGTAVITQQLADSGNNDDEPDEPDTDDAIRPEDWLKLCLRLCPDSNTDDTITDEGDGERCVQRPIVLTLAVVHIADKHYRGGKDNDNGREATFFDNEDIEDLVELAEDFAPFEDGINCKRHVHAGRNIGTPRHSSAPTPDFTVITTRGETAFLVTAFPGLG